MARSQLGQRNSGSRFLEPRYQQWQLSRILLRLDELAFGRLVVPKRCCNKLQRRKAPKKTLMIFRQC